jgi:hypothetical protein
VDIAAPTYVKLIAKAACQLTYTVADEKSHSDKSALAFIYYRFFKHSRHYSREILARKIAYEINKGAECDDKRFCIFWTQSFQFEMLLSIF